MEPLRYPLSLRWPTTAAPGLRLGQGYGCGILGSDFQGGTDGNGVGVGETCA